MFDSSGFTSDYGPPSGPGIDYRQDLNEAQYEAVTALDGPVLVVAGAGSGKTRTLVYRVAYLVEQGVPPESILLLTFTRKAAAEMLRRASILVGDGCSRVAGGTFHALAHELLRVYAPRLGFPRDFGIVDRGDMEDILSQLRARAGLNKKDKRFPRPGTLASMVSKAANKSEDVTSLLLKEYPHFLPYTGEIETLAREYALYKQQNGLVDLDDLLLLLVRLLVEDEEARVEIAGRYRYILVDEFQDTNVAQARIVELLARDHGNVMVVGDDAQSIYSFRGASFRNILDFPARFPGARIVRLEENYRSRQPILALSNHIISRAREKYDKRLFTRREGGDLPRLITTATEKDQSLFVLHRIEELIASGVSPNRIAVLFRAAAHSFDLEVELARRDLDFVKYGGRRFLEKAHIRDLLAILRVVATPGDRVSLMRVLLLLENVGPKSAGKVIAWVDGQRDRLAGLDACPVLGRLKRALSPLAALMAGIAPRGVAIEVRVQSAWDFYRPLMERKFDDYPERSHEVQEFLRLAGEYRGLGRLLADMALEPPDATLSRSRASDNADRLVLSTVHSAKGLEWHTVFVIWAAHGRFPPVFSRMTLESLDEERRLMYVAATRAEENLYFICPMDPGAYYGGLLQPALSPFLADVPRNLVALGSGSESVGAVRRVTAPGPPPQPPPTGGFQDGERVMHRVFGLGRVIGRQTEEKVEVDFDHFGRKILHVAYAGLERVDAPR